MSYRIWRSWSLADAGGRDREDEQLSGRSADRVQVIVIVPEKLVNFVSRKQSGVARNRVTSIEMEDLQTARAGNGEKLA